MIISLFGILGTCMAYFLINSFATSVIREQSGVLMKGVDFDQVSVFLFGGILLVGLISGLIPAFQAYRVDLSENLKPLS